MGENISLIREKHRVSLELTMELLIQLLVFLDEYKLSIISNTSFLPTKNAPVDFDTQVDFVNGLLHTVNDSSILHENKHPNRTAFVSY